jgi:hypothetical protein
MSRNKAASTYIGIRHHRVGRVGSAVATWQYLAILVSLHCEAVTLQLALYTLQLFQGLSRYSDGHIMR